MSRTLRNSVVVSGAYYRVERKSIEAVVLGSAAEERADAFGKLLPSLIVE